MVMDFFKGLVRGRVEGVRATAQAKVYGAKAKAQGKVANSFNKAVDAPLEKAKAKAKGVADKKKDGGDKKDEKGDEKVGFFSKKKEPPSGKAQKSSAPAEDFEPGMKTQAIDITGLEDERSQDVVGWIVCLNGPLRGRDFRLVTGRNTMGTAADCDVVLTDPYLSSKHSVIRHENGEFQFIDLDSTNGCFVNDRKVTKIELIDNDKVRIGRTEMKFKSLF